MAEPARDAADSPGPDDGATLQEVEQRESSPWRFVMQGWFQGVAAVMIFANIVLMVVEANHDGLSRYSKLLTALDHVLLCFYIFEIVFRVLYFRRYYLCGRAQFVAWNVLDIVVVAAGIVEQGLVALLPQSLGGGLQAPLRVLRFLRLFRALKIIRIFFESDLSWTASAQFQSFMGVVIASNSFMMGLETDIEWEGWKPIEFVLLTIYAFELLCNLKHSGFYFLSCYNPEFSWNILDFVIVASSIADSWLVPIVQLVMSSLTGGSEEGTENNKGIPIGQLMMLMRMLRLLRILRLVKLIKSVRPLFLLVSGVVDAVQGVFWVLCLTVVTLYAMGIMSTRLIGQGLIFSADIQIHDELKPFKCVPDSMFTLFRVMSGSSSAEEAGAIDFLLDEQPAARFAFIFFMVTSSWTLLSILTAVVSERMIAMTERQSEEQNFSQLEELRNEQTRSLIELFEIIDVSHDGKVSPEEVMDFLADEEGAKEILNACRITGKDALEVLHTIERTDHDEIDIVHFVDRLQDAGSMVKEKSVMKLNARIAGLEDTLSVVLHTLQLQRPKVDQMEMQSLPQLLAEAAQCHQQRPDSEPTERTGSSKSSEDLQPFLEHELQEAVHEAVMAKLDLLVEQGRKDIDTVESLQQILRQALSQRVAREVAAATADAVGYSKSSPPLARAAERDALWPASDTVARELNLAPDPLALRVSLRDEDSCSEQERHISELAEHSERVEPQVRDKSEAGQFNASQLVQLLPL